MKREPSLDEQIRAARLDFEEACQRYTRLLMRKGGKLNWETDPVLQAMACINRGAIAIRYYCLVHIKNIQSAVYELKGKDDWHVLRQARTSHAGPATTRMWNALISLVRDDPFTVNL